MRAIVLKRLAFFFLNSSYLNKFRNFFKKHRKMPNVAVISDYITNIYRNLFDRHKYIKNYCFKNDSFSKAKLYQLNFCKIYKNLKKLKKLYLKKPEKLCKQMFGFVKLWKEEEKKKWENNNININNLVFYCFET